MEKTETLTAQISAKRLAECIKEMEPWQTANSVLQGIILELGNPDSYYTHSIYPFIDDEGIGCYEISAPVTFTGWEEHGEIIWDESEVEDFPEAMINTLLSELLL